MTNSRESRNPERYNLAFLRRPRRYTIGVSWQGDDAMMLLFQRLFCWFAQFVFSLRYRVRLHGGEQLRDVKGPVLILTNHPAYCDPPVVMATLWPWLRMRPLLFEGSFRSPVLAPFMSIIRAVRVPGIERASAEAREITEQAINEIIDGLRRGENFILWAAGRAQRDGLEHLGGARSAADILRAVPEAELIRVRTKGAWGSCFSYAYTGKAPRLVRNLFQSLGLFFANLVFFMPRRELDITVERVDRAHMPEPKRETLNPWLEAWFNAGGPETPTFVPYHFLFGTRTHEYPRPSGLITADLSRVTPETREAVIHLIEQRLNRKLSDADREPDTPLDRIGLDSLDRMEVTLAVEHQFGFSGDQLPLTIGQLWALAQGLVEREPPKPPDPAWFRPPSDQGPLRVLGDTIPEAFVARVLANPRDVAAADDLAGVVTYERMLVGALVLARRFGELPGANVGLLLPASVACDTAFLALHLAGKLPVLLNWTTGPTNLAHAARLMGLTHVITSRAFLDRAGVSVQGIEYVHLEDVRQGIGQLELLRTLLRVRYRPGSVRKHVPQVPPDRPAVVLFTSGSERAPKAVPLTHGNIIAEMRSGIDFLQFSRSQVILGFLPAFHSFGIAATSLLPLLGGMRVVHHPDPTDAAGLARKTAAYRPTMLVGTPTFVSYILERSQPGELASLRMIVVGAEKCPPSLYERAKTAAPDATLLEGYGITECSPVVAVNQPENNRPGTVGRSLPIVEVRAIDLETEAPVPPGTMGMLWVSGPTVFPGYIGFDGPSPFRERDGKRWYVTGDLAEVSADGFIKLAGRLKRFLKAGGEMISLPALEEPFARKFPPTEDGPRVAVEGVETEAGRRIVLFSTEPVTLADANALLMQEGFRGVMRLDEVRSVDSIPMLGTGKTDYKALRAMLTTEAAA
jgi:long-chain-fatty-acid--[acyl-carrier-protein] ligase